MVTDSSKISIPNIDNEMKKELMENGTIKYFKAGEIILQENSYIKTLPIVLQGSLKVMREEEDGKEILLYYIKAGETCVMSFLGGISNDKSKVKAVVEEDSEILLIPINNAQEWVSKYPSWCDFIFKLYHKRFEELLSVVNAMAFQKIDQRILDLLQKKKQLTGNNEINVTHQQLADELGTAREVVSRLLKQLEREKKITLSRNKINIL